CRRPRAARPRPSGAARGAARPRGRARGARTRAARGPSRAPTPTTGGGRGGRPPRRASRPAPTPGCGAAVGARARRGPGRRRGGGGASRAGTRPGTVHLQNCSRSETISGMIDVIVRRTIPAAPDAIWPLLDDPARLGEWFAFAESGEVLEGSGVG